jgi:hypothetical protein
MGGKGPKGRNTTAQASGLGHDILSWVQPCRGDPWRTLSGLRLYPASTPRPLAWAVMGRPVGAQPFLADRSAMPIGG